MNDNIVEIKRRIDMMDVCNRYGIDVNKRRFACCVFHSEKTPSLRIYEKSFHCFGCGANGDVIDFVKLYFGIDMQQAIVRINSDFNLGLPLGRKPTLQEIQEARKEEQKRESIKIARKASYWIWWERYQKAQDSCQDIPMNDAQRKAQIKTEEDAQDYALKVAERNYQQYVMGYAEEKMNEYRYNGA